MCDVRKDALADLLDELRSVAEDALIQADRRTAVGRTLDRLAGLATRIRDARACDAATIDEREASLAAEVGRLLVRDEARTAIASAGGDVELMLPVVAARLRAVEQDGEWVVRVADGDRVRHVVRHGTGTVVDMTPADLVGELRRDPVYRRGFDGAAPAERPVAADQSAQGGAGGKNPFLKGASWNLTEQMKMKRENPSLAAAMQAQAEGAQAPDQNPFRRGPSWNFTRQMALQKSDPARAEQLRAEAETAT